MRRAVFAATLALAAAGACTEGPLDAIALEPNSLADGLLAHYTFDEGSGSAVVDHSGNDRNGVLTRGTWITDGEFGGALHLGGSDYVTVASFPNMLSSLSVSAWVRSTSMPDDGYETVVSTEIVFQGGWQLNLDKTASDTAVHEAFWDTVRATYTYYECPCMPLGQWAHLAMVVDADAHTLTMYVDGQVETVTPAPNPMTPGSAVLYIGRWSMQDRLLVGDVDDIAIYNRALASAEVQALGRMPPPDPM
jgi:hypothetical protein